MSIDHAIESESTKVMVLSNPYFRAGNRYTTLQGLASRPSALKTKHSEYLLRFGRLGPAVDLKVFKNGTSLSTIKEFRVWLYYHNKS